MKREAEAVSSSAGSVKHLIKHVLSLQTGAAQKLLLLFDSNGQTLVSSPDKDKSTTLVSVTRAPLRDFLFI